MNTPSPCDKCEVCYCNILYKDDPSYECECRDSHYQFWGDPKCPHFVHWHYNLRPSMCASGPFCEIHKD
jgi:hypothetical protein